MKEFQNISDLKRFLYRLEDIKKLSRQIRRLDVLSCNIGLNDKQQKRTQKLLNKLREIAKEFNLFAYHQGDPRGCTVYLLDERSNLNDYSEGIPIY